MLPMIQFLHGQMWVIENEMLEEIFKRRHRFHASKGEARFVLNALLVKRQSHCRNDRPEWDDERHKYFMYVGLLERLLTK